MARAHERFADALDSAGFDAAMTVALAAEPVLCGDETPVNVAHKDTDGQGNPVSDSPHVVVVRSPDERLVWYRSLSARSKKALTLTTRGLFSDHTSYLVHDDYAAWHQFDPQLAGTQQCPAHVFRYLASIHEMHPSQQEWAALPAKLIMVR